MACAQCHAEIVEQWKTSQHANANRLVSDAIDRNAFDPPVTLEHGSFVTAMARSRKGNLAFSVSFSNQPADTYHAEAVIGITPLRQYLVSFPGGRLQTVDVSYDPRSNEWFNAFGEENRQPHEWGFWKNRSMTWNVQCAFCHMTGFEKNYDIPTDTYASDWKAMGISCAQCHNVREAHEVSGIRVPAFAKATADKQATGRTNECPMVVPFHPETRNLHARNSLGEGGTPDATHMDNCASCHSRREELFGTFKAGDRFHDHFRLALPDSPGVFHHDGQVLDEDFEYASFMMSRMGHKGVTCLDCHNPHSGKLVAPYEDNSLCMKCHTPPGLNGAIAIDPVAHSFHKPGTPGSRCVDCHMPVHTYMMRDGRRDHGFTSPDPLLTMEHGIPNACTMCHADKTAEWAHGFTTQWYGDKMDRRARDRARVVARAHAGDRSAGDDLLAMARSEEIAAWRAALNVLLGAWADRDDVVAHLRDDLSHSSPLVRSASVRALQDREDSGPRIKPLLSDTSLLVRIDAAWALNGLGDTTVAMRVKELKAYLDNISDQPPGALRQAQYAINQRDLATAETWATKALAWDPTSVPRYTLGRIQHLRGNLPGATSNILAAAIAETNQAEYSYALALLYGETGDNGQVLSWLQETVRRDPGFGRAWYNLGLAHAQSFNAFESAKALARAGELMPENPDPLYAMGTLQAQAGNWSKAEQLARRCLAIDPSHAAAQRLLSEALSRQRLR